jgi:cytochrome c peroxidase
MRHQRVIRIGAAALVVLAGACADAPLDISKDIRISHAVTAPVQLGQTLFEDRNLSVNRNQSCASCHEPAEGFAAPLSGVVTRGSVVQGSVAGKFGDRKPPTAAYATIAPLFTSGGSGANGGNFWDGRATGAVLGNPAADQALGPFLNPAEQALPDAACVVYRVRNSGYITLFTDVWGTEILSIAFPANTETVCATPVTSAGAYVALTAADRLKVERAYHNTARSIAEFETSVNKYSSKFDANTLSALEQQGAKLFSGKAKCQQCHTSGVRAAFTDFNYHNLGVPKNPNNPVYNYSTAAADPGLGGFTKRSAHLGKFKTPTVRNAAMGSNRSYMHNGVLTSLKQVVDFYNTRDVLPVCSAAQIAVLDPRQYGSFDPDGTGPLTAARCWPPAEHPQNLDTKRMGNLSLTEAQVDQIVAFMQALSDR